MVEGKREMSYVGISVREAIEKINNINSGWYLPYIQRQYVWGDRYRSEEYICLLLDSLINRYPIGGLVLWETTKAVPYREFLRDYEAGKFARQVEEGRWGAHKFLVYDGQQRLQTLYSVLYYTFNGRVLHFDLLFDRRQAPTDETGLLFRSEDQPSDVRYLKLTQLVSTPCDPREKRELERRVLEPMKQVKTIDDSMELVILTNLAALWGTFVEKDQKSIAYFPVDTGDEDVVNEAFRRLNIGGIELTEAEQVLGEIKKRDFGYEEKLWKLSETIRGRSGGIVFSSEQALQFFHLLVKETTRISAYRFVDGDASLFLDALRYENALIELFEGYLWGLFKINNSSSVPRWLAVLPLGIYLSARMRAGHEWRVRAMRQEEVSTMNTYFLLAEFCDWNTQTMVNNFAKLADQAGASGNVLPVDEFRKIAIEKGRTAQISSLQFRASRWFALKVLTPSRTYVFHENKPQLDHIFPEKLEGTDSNYEEMVDVLWNLQPIPDGINNFKRARNPKEFFNSPDGAKYFDEYDFVPERKSPIWDDPARFIEYRQEKMQEFLIERYGMELDRVAQAPSA
jgi:hypothetical protein